MFSRTRPSVREYVREALGAMGAEWEETPDEVTLVMLPGESDIRRVTFEPEVAREERQVELVAHGSRFLELLTDLGCRRGRLARGFATPVLRPPPALSRAYEFRAEQLTRTEWAERVWTTWVFAFQVSFVGEFRRDGLTLVAVDAASLRLVRRFEEPFAALSLSPNGPEPSSGRALEECYAVAREEMLRTSQSGFKAAQRESDESLERELERLGRYYDGLLEEMSADLQRAPADDPRRAGIVSRMEAVKADRARAIVQSRERYQMSLETEVIGALGVVYPRLAATVTLADKKGRRCEVEAAWDPVMEQFEPLRCPTCRRPTYELELRGPQASCGCVR